jgi:tetratricopeptide (TPR) repeat protein
MNSKFIFRLCAIALVLWLLKMGWDRVEGDDGMMLVYFFTVGLAVGLLIVKYVLPAFGDAVGTMVYSSGEKVQPTESHKAAAKVAQGDYEGAIAEHEKSLSADPSQTYPIAEIAKICADKLHDPQRGLQVLQRHLDAREWSEEDSAFLQFRLADMHWHQLSDFTSARQVLEQIITLFPNSRHSANAHHKLKEVEQAEYRHLEEQRAKSGS